MIDIKHFVKSSFFYFIYKILLDICYLYWVHPIYEYARFSLDIMTEKVIISYLMLLIFSCVIPKKNKRVSYMILQLHLIVMIIPMLSLYSMSNLSSNFMFMVFFCFSLQALLVRFMPRIKTSRIKELKIISYTIFCLLTMIVYLYLFKNNQIYLWAFNFNRVYEIRETGVITNAFISYLVSWQYRIINPLLVVYGYMKKKKSFIILAVALQTVMFMMLAHKEILLSIGLLLLALYVAKKAISFDIFFAKFMIFASIVGVIVYEFFDVITALSLILVRLLFVPAQIKFFHYEFFSINEKINYSEGLIGKILSLEYPYDVPHGFLVGNPASNENAGYLAYAYANAGFWGMIVMSVFFVLLLLFIDSIISRDNQEVIFSLLIYPMIILNDGDVLTVILTGGLFLLIMYLMSSRAEFKEVT